MFDDLADGAVRETDCLVAFYDLTGFMTYAKGRAPADSWVCVRPISN